MLRHYLILTLAWFIATCDVCSAQGIPQPYAGDVGAGAVGPAVRVVQLAEPMTPAADGEVVPLPYRRAPEPPSADWGRYLQPEAPPVTIPPQESTLAGPRHGIFQRPWGQVFRSTLIPQQIYSTDRALDNSFDFARPDALAPPGVFGDHTLPSGGQVLMSYRHLTQAFNGNLSGTRRVGDAEILTTFKAAPDSMRIDKDVMQLEWAPTADLTIMAYMTYVQNTINYTLKGGGTTTTNVNNLSDIPIYLLYNLGRWDGQQLILNMGLDMPVGFLDSLTRTPTFGSLQDAYPQRTMSGTLDFLPGLTYRGQTDRWAWGAQTLGTVNFLGNNYAGYNLGDSIAMTTWAQRRFFRSLAASTRLDGHWRGNINGADSRLDPTSAPTTNPNFQAGTRVDLLFGMSYYLPGPINPLNHYLSIESGFPIYQNLTGPQLAEQWILNGSYNLLY